MTSHIDVFAVMLRDARIALNLTQAAVADLIAAELTDGCDLMQVSKWEPHRRPGDIPQCVSLSAVRSRFHRRRVSPMTRRSATRIMRITVVTVAALTTGCGGAGDPTGRWVDNWCQVRPTMTPGEATGLMGEATRQRLEGASAFMQWSYREYQFNAFLGADGRIRQLDTNTIRLTRAQVRAIGCGTTRRNLY